MMAKIGSLQKMMTSLDIFVKEKSSPNNLRNLPLKRSTVILGHPVYAAALGEKLRQERGVLSGSQAGFRRDMRTMDQVYALNYLVNTLGRKEGKMTVMFVNLWAAFNTVNREISKTEGERSEKGIGGEGGRDT
ncbi:axoneme-associated protein [Lasius niger]|uniref:Axoneme-associated protein n=1 Tax=Lasius niger TaxID=67767 RepID=A0A0J7K855_LASNI|nr:axoneme-associated protein [Lasius niger]